MRQSQKLETKWLSSRSSLLHSALPFISPRCPFEVILSNQIRDRQTHRSQLLHKERNCTGEGGPTEIEWNRGQTNGQERGRRMTRNQEQSPRKMEERKTEEEEENTQEGESVLTLQDRGKTITSFTLRQKSFNKIDCSFSLNPRSPQLFFCFNSVSHFVCPFPSVLPSFLSQLL